MREQRIKLPRAVLGLFTIHIECFKVIRSRYSGDSLSLIPQAA